MKSTLIYESLRRTGPQICLSGSGRARLLWVTIEKYNSEGVKTGWGVVCVGVEGVERGMAADGDRSKGNKVEARKESRAARGPRLKGEREQLALPKAIKVWFTHSLNKSTYHPSLPFFQVCGFHRSAPTPTMPSALSFPPTLAWQNCEFHNETRASCRPPWTVFFFCTCSVSLCLSLFNGCRDRRSSSLFSHFFLFLAMLARRHAINLSRASFGIMQIPKWFLFLRPLSSLCRTKRAPHHHHPALHLHPPSQPWQDFP